MGSVVCAAGGGGGASGIMNVDGRQFAPFQNEFTAGTVIALPSCQHHRQTDENVHPVGLVPQLYHVMQVQPPATRGVCVCMCVWKAMWKTWGERMVLLAESKRFR